MLDADLSHAIRSYELDYTRKWLRPGMRVLEIGGGDGWQAKQLAAEGFQVTSLDVESGKEHRFFPVRMYDGVHLPFQAASFDAVFTSNTLEHVTEVHQLLNEIHRILVPGGLAIHIVPSASWRLWTSLTHYVNLIQLIFRRLSGQPKAAAQATKHDPVAPTLSSNTPQPLWHKALRRLSSGPHGVYPTAFSELYYFSRFRWKRVFAKKGFILLHAQGNHLYYSGYTIVSNTPSLGWRRALSRLLGSSCHCFVLRRP